MQQPVTLNPFHRLNALNGLSALNAVCTAALLCLAATVTHAAAPAYTIIDLGVVGTATASQANGISPNGANVVGRSLTGNTLQQATLWTAGTGQVAQPNLAGRNFAVANAVNNSGVAVGNSLTTSFGSGALPMVWSGGVGTQLPLPAGQTLGRANAINASGVVAGSVNGGSSEIGVIYSGGSASVITATTANGSFMRTAYGISDGGLVVGSGVDPTNAAITAGLLYNSVTGTMTSLGALPSGNSALPFGISPTGTYVVGSSSFNGATGTPFIWTAAGGMTAIPFPTGTSQGSARAVNAAGWAVGTASSAFAIPFVYDGSASYRLADLIPAGTGWDLSTNTSSSAMGISADGTIVGTAVRNGLTHAYAMVLTPVPEPTSWALMLAGLMGVGGIARRRAQRRADQAA